MKKEFLGIGLILASLNLGTLFAASNISIEQAQAIALKKVPGATITNIELDYENNKSIYDIDLVLNQYEYDLKLDAKTGSGISIKKELRDGASNTTQLSKNYITKEQAKNAALGHIPGATVLKVELDKDDAVYELDLKKGNVKYDVVVSAITGKVLSSEIDD